MHKAAGLARGGAPARPRANARGDGSCHPPGTRPLSTFLQGGRWLLARGPRKTAAERSALENAPIRKHSDALNTYFVASVMDTLLPVITVIYLPVNKDRGLLVSTPQNETLLRESAPTPRAPVGNVHPGGHSGAHPTSSRGRRRTEGPSASGVT